MEARTSGRPKRLLLAGLMAFLTLNVWTGSPLLALWVGSRVQGSGPPSMGAVAVVVLVMGALSIGLFQLLKRVSSAYDEATGHTPTVRAHAPWLRSMRGERPDYAEGPAISAIDRVVVLSVMLAAAVFEVWFFFFSGSPIGSG